MRNDTPILTPRRPLSSLLAVSIVCAPGLLFGWSASGIVENSTGTAISGVAVTVQDSASISTSTGPTGAFSIGSTTGIVLDLSGRSTWSARATGGELEIQSPVDGPLSLSLVDAQGRAFWGASAVAREGTARAAFPADLRYGAAFLRIRHGAGETDLAVTTGPEGLGIASHIAAPRSLATFPVLLFKKSGYRDTSYAMAAASATSLSISMSDTGTPLLACPSPALTAKDYNRTVVSGGATRTYILHVPAKYDGSTSTPLVIDFHGVGGSGSQEEGAATYKALTDADGVVTAYPDGTPGPLGNGWDVGPCCVANVDDVAFSRALVADIEKVACINPKKVYAVGFSNGGGLSHLLGCKATDLFAAIGPMSFDFWTALDSSCAPSRPITVVAFRGTADPAVPYGGGLSSVVPGMSIQFIGAVKTFDKWASLDQCTGSPSAADANNCSTFSNCGGGVQVTLCTIQGGGHAQGNGSVGWPILKKFSLP
ncbi:MAG TPA: PHB depolymerase family esterase [Fibrobacteria bacterium]|nr:PHB depolymerase family esterase [Fibrobacteria bacterium]